MCLFAIFLLTCYTLLFAFTEKNILNISNFYSDILSFRTVIMHTQTISNQERRTGPALHYNSAKTNEYLCDSDSYNNDSDYGSDDYNIYESNYKSDSEEAPRISTSTTVILSFQLPNIQEQKSNATYILRQKKFNNDFTPKDLLNSILKILSLSPRDMSNDKGSLDCLPIYSFLFSNEKGSSLYNAYNRNEVNNKLVIKIDQDADWT